MFVIVIARIMIEKIKKYYYLLRYPESTIKVVMHYPNNMYKTFYRILPTNRTVKLLNGCYYIDNKQINKNSDLFVKEKNNKYIIGIENKNYDFIKINKINTRWDDIPEIHYRYNNPAPLDFSVDEKHDNKISYNAKELKEVVESSVISKLLNLDEQNKMLILVLIMVVLNFVATIFIILVITGTIEIG
jgi:hypothetical protein